ncbi:hypothetical protein FB451DRAFT_1267542 [Mycena latifolia]|nr:hypothetical protein FB451DRAFT_1267542 [Mycena latifolia]
MSGILIPSPIERTTSIVVLVYQDVRYFFPDMVPASLNKLMDLALNSLLYLIVGRILLSALVSLTILPLVSALVEDSPDAASVRPKDEESLVPDVETQSSPEVDEADRPLRGIHLVLGTIFVLVSLVLVALLLAFTSSAASAPRRRYTTRYAILQEIWERSFQLFKTVVENTGTAAAVVLSPPLLLFAPILILMVAVARLKNKPQTNVWARVIIACTRLTVGVFVYLLAIEGLNLYQPARLEAVLPHLARQAALLSDLYKWLGLGAYAYGTLWFFTDRTAVYFCARAVTKLKLQRKTPLTPGPRYLALLKLVRVTRLPLAMICNGYMCSAPRALDGLGFAAIIIACITTGVLALFLVDLAVYWMCCFIWKGSTTASDIETDWSVADAMAVTVFAFVSESTRRTGGGEEGAAEGAAENQAVAEPECDLKKGAETDCS